LKLRRYSTGEKRVQSVERTGVLYLLTPYVV
jgi:hypothetical protein